MARPSGRPLRQELVEAGCQLIQSVGVGAFNYSALAQVVGVKAPSVHHHFPRKEDLVAEVARQYRLQFADLVAQIDDDRASERLRSFALLFSATAAKQQMCLCGSVAAEWNAVGDGPREQVEGFFDDQLSWLCDQVANGVRGGEFPHDLNPQRCAEALLAALEGATLLSRSGGRGELGAHVGDFLVDLVTRGDT